METATFAADVRAIVIMGVAGSGKSTVASLLATRLGWRFAEADAYHSAANVAKMRSGTPLTDADRAPWLDALADAIDAWRASGEHGVIACSALKRAYRERLIRGHADVRIAYLEGDYDTIAARLASRTGHYMPAILLASQFEALEPPAPDEGAIVVPIDSPPEAAADRILVALGPLA